MNHNPLTLRPRQAAQLLGVSTPTLRSWIRKHGLPSVRLGRSVLIPLDGLRAWLADQARKQAEADVAMQRFLSAQGRDATEGGAQ